MGGTQPAAGQVLAAPGSVQRGSRLASPAMAAVLGGLVLALMIAEPPASGWQ